MNIATGMAGLKAAADLARTMRDAAKAETLKPDEFAGRLGEIYDYIIDSKDALVEAKDQLQELKEQVKKLQDASEERKAIQAELIPEDNAYFRAHDAKKDGPFCTACWDDSRKLMRLTSLGVTKHASGWKMMYLCALHPKHEVPMSRDYLKASHQ